MALENTDLLVVQKGTGGQEIRKCTLQQLDEFIQGGESVTYKGSRDFTDAGAEPAEKNGGDLYINNGDGTWQWASGANNQGAVDVTVGDRCIWNIGGNGVPAGWDVIVTNVAEDGVVGITGTLPIDVENGSSATPNITIQEATTASDGTVTLATQDNANDGAAGRVITADLKADKTGNFGTVTLASDADVALGDATVNTKVVTADQLKITNDNLAGAIGGGVTAITGIDPIETFTDGTDGSTINSPVIKIKPAAVSQTGASPRYDATTLVGDPSDGSDGGGTGGYDGWVTTLDDEGHMTMAATAALFVPANFAGLEDA